MPSATTFKFSARASANTAATTDALLVLPSLPSSETKARSLFQRPQWKRSLAETFRETDHAYLSPRRVGDALGLQIQSLAERARVSRNTPAVRPQNETLQHYLREVVRVLTAAEDVAGGDRHRAIFWFMNEPLQDFDYLTPDALVRMGKSQVVIDYIESIAGGATG